MWTSAITFLMYIQNTPPSGTRTWEFTLLKPQRICKQTNTNVSPDKEMARIHVLYQFPNLNTKIGCVIPLFECLRLVNVFGVY